MPTEPKIVFQPTPNLSLETPIFDDNPAKYCGFVNVFDTLVSYSISEPKHKPLFLLHYTREPAYALVQGCQHMPPNEGHFKARELLEQIFGQKFQIAKACVDLIVKGPQLQLNENQP